MYFVECIFFYSCSFFSLFSYVSQISHKLSIRLDDRGDNKKPPSLFEVWMVRYNRAVSILKRNFIQSNLSLDLRLKLALLYYFDAKVKKC